MKYLIIVAFLLTISGNAFPKEPKGKTVLILFDKTELKEVNSSPEYIGLSLSDNYKTQSYAGYSEAALLITLTNSALNVCQIGEIRVQVNPSTWLPLQEIAYRIIDLDENKDHYQELIAQKNPEAPKRR